MMVKYADNIRKNNLDCKSHQAYLSDIETKTVLNLESDQIQELIPNENNTDNERENLGELSHVFSTTIHWSCGEKAATKFAKLVCTSESQLRVGYFVEYLCR